MSADPRAPPAARGARRRRLRRRPDGACGLAAPDPGRADRSRCGARPRESARDAVRPTTLPRVSDRGNEREGTRRRPADSVVLVFGGSQGAQSLNEAALRAWGEAGPNVLHLSGERDYAALRACVRRDGYRLLPFVDDFGAALGAADLVVARAGGSVWEIAAAGKPAILVPYPHATADHQRRNAEYFAAAGGAVVVDDRDAPTRVPQLVDELLADGTRRARMAAAMHAAAKPDAAERIADELIVLAAARG